MLLFIVRNDGLVVRAQSYKKKFITNPFLLKNKPLTLLCDVFG